MSVIQRGSPGGRVNRPSRDIPHFAMTNGRWVTIHLLKASLRRVHSLAKTLCRILTPAFRNCAMPLPEWRGLTSTAPTTTFLTPALRIASVHGAVRPTVEQGSRVTYSVARAGTGASKLRRHSISACSRPAPRWCPFATIRLSMTRTAPTAGLGLV